MLKSEHVLVCAHGHTYVCSCVHVNLCERACVCTGICACLRHCVLVAVCDDIFHQRCFLQGVLFVLFWMMKRKYFRHEDNEGSDYLNRNKSPNLSKRQTGRTWFKQVDLTNPTPWDFKTGFSEKRCLSEKILSFIERAMAEIWLICAFCQFRQNVFFFSFFFRIFF